MEQSNFWNANAQNIINSINVKKLLITTHKKKYLINQINEKQELFYLKSIPLLKLNTILLTVLTIVKREEATKWRK